MRVACVLLYLLCSWPISLRWEECWRQHPPCFWSLGERDPETFLCGSSPAGLQGVAPAHSHSDLAGPDSFQLWEEPPRARQATAAEGNHNGITSWLLPQIHVTHRPGWAAECGWGTTEGGMKEWGEGNGRSSPRFQQNQSSWG